MAPRMLGRLTGLLALLIAGLVPSVASAATLYITEYSNIGAIGTSTTPWPPGQAVTTQTVVVGGASLQSAAFNAATKAISVTCDIGCSVLVGSNPTATTATTLLQQGDTTYMVVAPAQKIAVIANTAGDLPGGGGGGGGTLSSNITQTGGNTLAADDAAAGTTVPLPIGGLYTTTYPAYTNGDRAQAQFSGGGGLIVGTGGSIATGSDGLTNSIIYPYSTSAGSSSIGTRTGLSVAPVEFNGTLWDRTFTCPNTAVVSVTAAATTQIVALAASQQIRICSIAVSMTAAGTVTFTSGTGTNCGSGTTPLSGAMTLATGAPLTISSGNGSVLRTAAGNAFCITAATGNVTGFVTYAQY